MCRGLLRHLPGQTSVFCDHSPMTPALLVRDLSEDQLLARILPLLAAPGVALVGPGDDCAVLAASDGRYVVTTDVLVEDRHFRTAWSSGFDVGWRAAMQNLADVVAMGAHPAALVVSLVVPGSRPVVFVEDLARGMAAACRSVGAGVVGGDLSGGDQLVVAVTAHGDLAGREPVLRSGARPGDVIALAGTLGRSAAGLALLDADREVVPFAELVETYLRPRPPLTADTRGATAMLDISDGLLRDATRLAVASGVGLDLCEADLAPDIAALGPAAVALGSAPGESARGWVLTGGEDHGLLATFPSGYILPEGFRRIGVATAANTGTVLLDGRPPAAHATGWDHFAGA